MWQFNGAKEELIELLRMLRAEGSADLSGKGDRPCMTPLLLAARLAKVKVCRFLVADCAADMHSVLGVDPVISKPFLHVAMSFPGDGKEPASRSCLRVSGFFWL